MASTAMSAQDALWLTMDRPNNLMVIDGAMVLAEQIDIDDMRAVFEAAGDRFPVFRRRPEKKGQSWHWVDDPNFDIDAHVHEVVLKGDGDLVALQRFVAVQRARPLDRSRPLWESFLVSSVVLDDGTIGSAVVTRFHHAIADGGRITQVMLGLCDPVGGVDVPAVARAGASGGIPTSASSVGDVALEALRVSAAATRATAGFVSDAASTATGAVTGVASAVGGAVRDPAAAMGALPGAVAAIPGTTASVFAALLRSGSDGVDDGISLVRHPDRLLDALEVLGADQHRPTNDMTAVAKLLLTDSGTTVWTGTPGKKKAVSWSAPMPLKGIKAIGRASGATVNDVLLTAVAGALRAYLAAHQEALDEVVWMVPVNLTPFADELPEDLGNNFALVMLPMPLHHDSADERLNELHHRMERIKHSDEAVLTFGLQYAVSASPSILARFMTNFFANKAVGVLTNVPGPTGLLLFAGVPVTQIVGFAPCSGNQPMTATIFSYNGAVTVGFATDASLVPDPDVLAALVVDEIAQMAVAAK